MIMSLCSAICFPWSAICLPWSAICLPWSAICLSCSFIRSSRCIMAVSRFSMARKYSSSTFMSCLSLASAAAASRRCMICIISSSPAYSASSIFITCLLCLSLRVWSNTLSTSSSLLLTFPCSRGIWTMMLSCTRLSTKGSGSPFVTSFPS